MVHNKQAFDIWTLGDTDIQPTVDIFCCKVLTLCVRYTANKQNNNKLNRIIKITQNRQKKMNKETKYNEINKKQQDGRLKSNCINNYIVDTLDS